MEPRKEKTKILDLGCGKKKYPESVGIDISPESDANVIHDLNVFPYPFKDNEFEYVYSDNVLEHLDDVIKVMEELHRITGNGATIKIVVPYFRSIYSSIDPTHKHCFTSMSFDYFVPEHMFNKLYKYSNAKFRVKKVVFDEEMHHNLLGRMIVKFANKRPSAYEFKFSHLFPLNTLTFYLETVK